MHGSPFCVYAHITRVNAPRIDFAGQGGIFAHLMPGDALRGVFVRFRGICILQAFCKPSTSLNLKAQKPSCSQNASKSCRNRPNFDSTSGGGTFAYPTCKIDCRGIRTRFRGMPNFESPFTRKIKSPETALLNSKAHMSACKNQKPTGLYGRVNDHSPRNRRKRGLHLTIFDFLHRILCSPHFFRLLKILCMSIPTIV